MTETLSEYWCDRKILVTIDGPHRHSTIRIEKPFARIGSHPESDIVLDHDDVDKRSLYLHATDAGIFCFGLSAAQSDLRGWMDPNEAVAVGPYWISAQLTDPVELSDQDPDADVFALTEPSPLLLVRCDGNAAGEFHLKRRLSILGRKAPCKLRLQGQEISGAHCVFFVDSQQTWVIDLLSTAGTIVRGKPCEAERIEDDDRVSVANVELVLKNDDTPPDDEQQETAPSLMTDSSESVELKEGEKGRQGEGETGRQGDKETGRRGDAGEEQAETQHPHRPLSAEIDKIFVSKMVDEEKKAATVVPKSKPRPVDANRPVDDLDRVTNRLVDIEIHKKRQRLWRGAARLVVFLLVSAICVGGLAVAYKMLPNDWKPVWGQRE